MSKIYQNNI